MSRDGIENQGEGIACDYTVEKLSSLVEEQDYMLNVIRYVFNGIVDQRVILLNAHRHIVEYLLDNVREKIELVLKMFIEGRSSYPRLSAKIKNGDVIERAFSEHITQRKSELIERFYYSKIGLSFHNQNPLQSNSLMIYYT